MSLELRMGDEIITDQVTNIQTKNIWQGGYASVTFNVKRKLDQALFDTFTDVFTYDPATGEQTGGGRLLEQGRNDDGTWRVTCLGEGLASMQDITTPWFAISKNLDTFYRNYRTTKRLDVTVGNYPVQTDEEPTIVCDVTQEGITIAANAAVEMTTRLPSLCNQRLGGFAFKNKAGITDSNFRIYACVLSADRTVVDVVKDNIWGTTLTPFRIATVGGDFTDRYDVLFLFKRITSTSASATEDYWATVRDFVMRAQLYGANGSLTTTGYDTQYDHVLPHQVLTDWVVRYCPRLNAATGTIDTTSTEEIEQMEYLDGIHGMQLADDVAAFEPGFAWQVWGQEADGTWPFHYVPLPSMVQYEASIDDGFSSPSPSTEIYDEVVVTGKTSAGRDLNRLDNLPVPALDAAGFHRRITIPLGSEIWSTAAANKVGDQFLAEHAVAPNAGTVTIARPIYDAPSGRWIGPQHIRGGGLMRIRGIQPTPNSLNATSSDGVTVFRVVSATFDNDSNSCVCELDSYTLTESRQIADLTRARTRRGAA